MVTAVLAAGELVLGRLGLDRLLEAELAALDQLQTSDTGSGLQSGDTEEPAAAGDSSPGRTRRPGGDTADHRLRPHVAEPADSRTEAGESAPLSPQQRPPEPSLNRPDPRPAPAPQQSGPGAADRERQYCSSVLHSFSSCRHRRAGTHAHRWTNVSSEVITVRWMLIIVMKEDDQGSVSNQA